MQKINLNTYLRTMIPTRQLHIEAKCFRLIKDNKGVPGALIAQTKNDMEEQSYSDYRMRSMNDLVKVIPKELEMKQLLLNKVNQCVINPKKWAEDQEVEVIYPGHIMSGVFKIEAGNLISIPNTL